MKYIVEIRDGRNKTYYYRSELYRLGFRFKKQNKIWLLKTDDNSLVEYYSMFAKARKLNVSCYDEHHDRNNYYRSNFFIQYKPQIHGKYICAYCGKFLLPEEVTVDHIIPIKKAKRNKLARLLMKVMRMSDVNSCKNLAASCLSCNAQKGSKFGIWTIRGFLGKHVIFWVIIYSYVLFMVLIMIYFLIRRLVLI
jgi:hypothetical protein